MKSKEKILEEYFKLIVDFVEVFKDIKINRFRSKVLKLDDGDKTIDEAKAYYKRVIDYINSLKYEFIPDIEKKIRNANLSDSERIIVYAHIYSYFFDDYFDSRMKELIKMVSNFTGESVLSIYKKFSAGSKLLNKGFLQINPNGKFEISREIIRSILDKKKKEKETKNSISSMYGFKINKDFPKKLYEYLSSYVIGQEEVLRKVSIAVYKHALSCIFRKGDTKSVKGNILLIGPTGTGKSYIAYLISKFLNVPFVNVNATQYTETGYVGLNVEDMVVKLYEKAGEKSSVARNGIIFIDEIDKIATKATFFNKDVSGRSVQEELLKLLEEDEIVYRNDRLIFSTVNKYDISNVLFIAAGAFDGIDDIIKSRIRDKSIGFIANLNYVEGNRYDITTEDLERYGFIPEFIGRFPSIIRLNSLGLKDLIDILKKSMGSPIKNYEKYLAESGVDYKFSDEDIRKIAQEAIALKTGARGLYSVLEKMFFEILNKKLYNVSRNSIV